MNLQLLNRTLLLLLLLLLPLLLLRQLNSADNLLLASRLALPSPRH